MISRFKAAVISLSALLLLSCNGGGNNTQPETLNVDFVLPSRIEVSDDTKEYTFDTKDGKSPLTTDLFMLSSSGGVSSACPITAVSPSSFTVRLGVPEGDYDVVLRRGDLRKSFGRTSVKYVDNIEFTPDEGTSVWGVVKCGDKGLPGVVVSDGAETVQTDERGIYQIKSDKKWGYVFISIPSGYEVPSDGVLPRFHSYLLKGPEEVERADFELIEAVQDTYRMLFFGDMHLANKSTDRIQFRDFAHDVNGYLGANAGVRVYAATLGDMTWDIYWYSTKYDFVNYLEEMNSSFSGLQVFHTMGNHDNDYMAKSDFDASGYYVSKIAPTYYSYNIGQIHYVVLDDIDCSAYDGTTSRKYVTSVSSEQLKWLEKDLSYIPKDMPVIVTSHAQVYSTSGLGYKKALKNADALLGAFAGFEEVHFVTGHTHRVYNITPKDGITEGRNIYEHNSGAVCGTWWHTGDVTPGIHISTDGAPGGYAVLEVDGKDMEWKFKATGFPESYQFRTYDLNNVSFSYEDVPSMPTAFQDAFRKYIDAYPKQDNNDVLVNVWNWNAGWKISVEDEDGNVLTPVRVTAMDPLHILSLVIPRYNNPSLTSTPSFMTSNAAHFFKVRAKDASTDLVITVEDAQGNSWTEKMERPGGFSVNDYKPKK